MKFTRDELKLIKRTKQRLMAGVDGDEEFQHIDADAALCDLLKGLGLNDVVELFNKIDKWYA